MAESAALCEWGMAGVMALHTQVAVLVIVDVLSFSTSVDIAVSRGATVYPSPFADKAGAESAAMQANAVLAQPRSSATGRFSLSPSSLLNIPAGTKLMLPSPNGSRLSYSAGRTPGQLPVLAGCLRNATAVARAARILAGDRPVGVIPAGEAWPDGSLRPAIEDMLGAGAILDKLEGSCSPEAQLARDAYRSAGRELGRLVRLSVSGRELVDRGFPGDVDLAVEQDVSASIPLLVSEQDRAATSYFAGSDLDA